MDINYLKDQLFDFVNESDMPIREIETDDIQNTMKIMTDDGKSFLLTLNEIQWQKVIQIESEPVIDEKVSEYLSTHDKVDFLNEWDALCQENPFLGQILASCMKLYEMELLTDSEYQRVSYQLGFRQEQLRQDYLKLVRSKTEK